MLKCSGALVLDCLAAATQPLSAADIAEEIKCAPKHVAAHLTRLHLAGRVIRSTENRCMVYQARGAYQHAPTPSKENHVH